MLILPQDIIKVIRPFAQVCSARVWDWAQVLIVGAVLALGKRTVTAALRVMGLKDEKQFQNYHRVLNRAKWSGLQASRILLGMLVVVLVSAGVPVVVAADAAGSALAAFSAAGQGRSSTSGPNRSRRRPSPKSTSW